MKNKIKGFSLGVLLTLIIIALVVPAFAASYTQQATLTYKDIVITLDGQQITPTDANGNVVEPFVIDGTTYLPVRAVADALGVNVGWDSSTNTVILTTSGVQASLPAQTQTESSQQEYTYVAPAESNNNESTSSSGTVYIVTSGSKYHSKSTCSNMKSPKAVTVEEAEAVGYTKCSKCW